MFDMVEIVVRAGNGGNGRISFRREKFVPLGGPDGGDGGDGGNVVVRADASTDTLREFQHKRLLRAENGGNGQSKRKHGKKGSDLMIAVPEGTMVWQRMSDASKSLLADLSKAGQEIVVAGGGRGGLGNTHFASATNQAPRIAQSGEPGEEIHITLELRLIADVGIVGYPNAGKSTLLGSATAAQPEVANYPFTTREPVLGVVEVNDERFIMAEIPGLIDGAHLGRGLGHDFLRHISRTRIIIHLIDGTSPSPVEDMIKINNELGLFDIALARKPQIVAVNKIDLPEVRTRLDEIKQAFGEADMDVRFISASSGEGVRELMAAAAKIVGAAPGRVEAKELPFKVFRPRPVDITVSVRKEGDIFVVESPELERLSVKRDMSGYSSELREELTRLGISQALAEAGIKPGDHVRSGSLEWEW